MGSIFSSIFGAPLTESQNGHPPLQKQLSMPVNEPSRGPFGLGVLPAVKGLLKDRFLSQYLIKVYTANYHKANEAFVPNTAVAHASTDPAMNTMNIAMPDLSAE